MATPVPIGPRGTPRPYNDLYVYLKPKVTLHCYYINHFWVLVSGILNVFNSY